MSRKKRNKKNAAGSSPNPAAKKTPAANPRKQLAFIVGAGLFMVVALGVVWWMLNRNKTVPLPQSNPTDNPVVLIDTSRGKIKVELFPEHAPITVKNFLQYVDDKHYDGTIFHRVISHFMIQGGGFDPDMKERNSRPPIENESYNGLSNERGTIAMARTSVPNSATDQFFINVSNKNSFLDRANAQDGVGYAVFGNVIEGMDVVDEIRGVETNSSDRPVEDVIIKSIRRVNSK